MAGVFALMGIFAMLAAALALMRHWMLKRKAKRMKVGGKG